MRQKFALSLLFVLLAGLTLAVQAQNTDIGIREKLAGGEVTSVGAEKIVLKTKDGAIDVVISTATEFKRIPPDNPKLSAAVATNISEIGVGDKLLVTGTVSADKKNIPAKAVYLITKSDLTQKQNKESEAWRARGVVGRVTAVNFQTSEVTISVRGGMMAGERTVVVTPKETAKFLRYAPNSVQYSEAKPSNIKEIFVGDIVRALGDKSDDGASFKAEQIVSGAFQTIAGTVKSVDAAKNEIVVENIQTKKDVTISVGGTSQMKKFPAEMAQRMAQAQAMRANGVQPPQQNNQTPPAGQAPPNQAGQGGGGMRGDLNDMFERLPVVTVADLKAGDMIAVSSTRTDDPTRATAIRLLAGVEPFLKAPQMPSGNRRGNAQGGQDSSFSIPGLDGLDTP